MQLSVLIILFSNFVKGDSTLKLVNLLYRHGDRSPVKIFKTDPNQADKWPQGLGWLTTIGMKEHYSLGEFLKSRYIDTGFMGKEYNHTEIQIESSDENRCLMSAYCNLAGLFPPDIDQQFNENVTWQPIPVHARPAKEDNTLNLGENCPRYSQAVMEVYKSQEVQKKEKENKAFYEWLETKSGMEYVNITNIWEIADTLFCEKTHNFTLAPWVNDTVFDKLRSLTDYQFELMFKTTEMQRLKGGPLLSEIIDNMRKKTKNFVSTKMFMYSAHDTTVAALLSALQVYDDISPPYTAMVVIELYQNTSGGYYVRLYYKNSTWNSLTIPGCSEKCPFEKFVELTKPVIPVDWLKECGLPSSSPPTKLSTAWIIVIILGVLLIILLLINVIMYVKYRRNRPGYRPKKLTNKA